MSLLIHTIDNKYISNTHYQGIVMKINEITEQPVSGIKTGLQGLGSRILNRIPGMKGRAKNLAARADIGDTARNVYNSFAQWLGNRNKKINQATGEDLKAFIDASGLDSSGIRSGPLDKKTLNSAMINAAVQLFSGTTKPKTAEPTAQPKSVKSKTPKSRGVQRKASKPKTRAQDRRHSDSFEKAKSQIRQLRSSGSKPLPDQTLQRLATDIRKLARGDKESGTYAADKILKFAQAGRDVSGIQQRWLQSARAGERFLTQSVYRAIGNLLVENNLSWRDLGLSVRLIENTDRSTVALISKI